MPTDLHRQFRQFRARHPSKRLRVGGGWWEYIACGRGTQTLLLLPGVPGRAETAFEYIEAWESEYRVISAGYPPHPSTVREVVEGLAGIMDAEGIQEAHVVGGSYSGLLAQCFVRRYPGRVGKLVLSDTGAPSLERARKYSRILQAGSLLPTPAIRALWRLGAYRYLRGMGGERAFWWAYFKWMIASITKEDCASRLEVWIDFDRNYTFKPADLSGWSGEVLILEAEDDATFSPQERALLRALYPRAQVHTFVGGGHAASLARRAEYIAAIDGFLRAPLKIGIRG